MSTRQRYFEYSEYIRRRKLIATLLLHKTLCEDQNTPRKKRKVWVHPYLLRRDEKGMHQNLFLELALEDPNQFRRCLRMNTASFEYLLQKVTPYIQKQDTHLRKSIPAAERLSLTLRHLATGESQESLRLTFRIGQSTISKIIKETIAAIVITMKQEYVRVPNCSEEWRNVAYNFGERWNFFNCIGAMDGKHIKIDPPLRSGSLFYNYKGDFSIVLLALVDAELRFIFADIGTNGRISDGGIWNKSSLRQKILEGTLGIPPDKTLPGTEKKFPFVIVGDEAFPLNTNLMIPYPGGQCRNRRDRRIFNYRLSRARRCSENAFGVLGARFQIYRAPLRYDPDDAEQIVWATICLHNWLRCQAVGRSMYTPTEFIDAEDELTGQIRHGEWRQTASHGMAKFTQQGSNHHRQNALLIRDEWCQYFNGIGAVEWQERATR